jgi:hypothetical protein
MTDEAGRYDRQCRLAEVGPAGQERIERAAVEVCGRDGATVELSYLCRAGLAEVTIVPGKPCEPFAHGGWFRFDSARSVGAGAWRALEKIKQALEIDGR